MGIKMSNGGFNDLFRRIEAEIGEQKMLQITDVALQKGAEMIAKELENVFRTSSNKGFSDGHTADEVHIDKARFNKKGEREVVIRWRGPENRYRLIHINEWGTISNPNPPWKGNIANAMRRIEEEYRRILIRSIEGSLK